MTTGHRVASVATLLALLGGGLVLRSARCMSTGPRGDTAALAPSAAPAGGAPGSRPEASVVPPAPEPLGPREAEGLRAFSDALTRGAREALGERPNWSFAPAAVRDVLAVLAGSLTGTPRAELLQAIHARPDEDLGGPWLERFAPGSSAAVTWKTAGAAFLDARLTPSPAFARALARAGAEIRAVRFDEGGEHGMDEWLRAKTDGLVPRLYAPGEVHPEATLALANTAVLRARWLHPFAKGATTAGPFRPASGREISVPMMHQRAVLRASTRDALTLVELPYADPRYVLLLAMPKDERALVQRGLVTTLLAARAALPTEEVLLALPRCEISVTSELRGALERLGVRAPFDTTKPHLHELVKERAPPVALRSLRHGVTLKLDEEGTVAAAATVATVENISPLLEITFDRPFALAVIHVPSETPMLVGYVGEPAAP